MAAGHVLTQAVDRIIEPVQSIHRHVAQKWFRRTDPLSRPVRLGHDVVSGVVYGLIRVGSRVGGRVIDARASDPTAQRMRAVVEGLWGDSLRRPGAEMRLLDAEGHSLSSQDGFTISGSATGHIVVLVHGLVETERTWGSGPRRPSFLSALADSPTLTPITVRYNSGVAIDDNGAELSARLDRLYGEWPVPIESIALVGHSMGGLVARRACKVAFDEGHRWGSLATDLVTIGAPHRGASLETLADLATRGLQVAPLTRPVGEFLEGRSRGIRDLHTDRDHEGDLPIELREHVVAGVITADPDHPVGAMVGDLMVTPASSTAAGRAEPASSAVVGGVHHFGLLTDQAVIDQVMSWIDPQAPTPAEAPA